MELTEADIDELFSKGRMTVRKDVRWRKKNGQSHHIEFTLPVENNFRGDELKLIIKGTKNSQTRDYSYCLLFNGQRLRSLDPYKHHNNRLPKRERIIGTHKHKWCDDANSSYAYVPTDITDETNMELTFREFLNECSVNFTGRFFDPPPSQLQIHIDGTKP